MTFSKMWQEFQDGDMTAEEFYTSLKEGGYLSAPHKVILPYRFNEGEHGLEKVWYPSFRIMIYSEFDHFGMECSHWFSHWDEMDDWERSKIIDRD